MNDMTLFLVVIAMHMYFLSSISHKVLEIQAVSTFPPMILLLKGTFL